MQALLNSLLPRLFPGLESQVNFLCVSHEGKSDLDRSVPKKLRGWREPNARFVIVRDTDGADCIQLKQKIAAICRDSGRSDAIIRLACQELESWYIGDLEALSLAFNDHRIASDANKKRFSEPDSWHKPSIEVARLAPAFQKISGARAMSEYLLAEKNRSHSFGVFVSGVEKLIREMGWTPVPSAA